MKGDDGKDVGVAVKTLKGAKSRAQHYRQSSLVLCRCVCWLIEYTEPGPNLC